MHIFPSSKVKNRKPHICLACCRMFSKGNIMERCAIKECGDFNTYYLCESCSELISMGVGVCLDDNSFDHGCMIEECKEHGVENPEKLLRKLKEDVKSRKKE